MKSGDMMNSDKHNDLNIPNCPYCGTKMLKIVYGMPTQETLEKAKNGEILLGGCIIEEKHPKYYCNNCKKSYAENLKLIEDESNNYEIIK